MTLPAAASRLALVVALMASVPAQQEDGLEALASWLALDMPTGYETRFAPELAAHMSGWEADRHGNLIRRSGTGSPRRLVACGLDRPSYAASQITADGYLRVHRIGRGSRHPLWDQAFEAQPVRVLTRQGPVAGVVARANAHFAQQHRHDTRVVTADDLWIDVGAESDDEVAALGIELLDPVARHLPAWAFAGAVAGPDAGRRAGCAVVALLAESVAMTGEGAGSTTFVLGAQSELGWVGVAALAAREVSFDQVVLLMPGEAAAVAERRPVTGLGRFGAILAARGVREVDAIAPDVAQPGAHVETISSASASALLRAAADAAAIEVGGGIAWKSAPAPAPLRTDRANRSLEPLAHLLGELIGVYGVSGHEGAVRRDLMRRLPEWARQRAIVDDLGNLFVEAGPDGEATVFVAHLDEVGFEVDSISPDGLVSLRGGAASAWEGQAALLHFDADADGDARPPMRGIFLTRDRAERKAPESLQAWFGLDHAGLAQRGVRPGMAVTGTKEGLRLGAHRYVARSLDDRAGTTALLMALHALDPSTLPSRTVFAWSVEEETGLDGATELARRFGATTRRVYSIDTFVTSDTPLESRHFAHAPLGSGPVLRAIENSSVSPDAERARVQAVAATAGIPLQLGLTQGGTDGTAFTFWGAPNQGLSWPGRYSHSPGEVLDLRDLARLVDLIVAVAMDPTFTRE